MSLKRKIFNWIKGNFLTFNTQKCKQMSITRKKVPGITFNITVDGNALKQVESYKYLGVWITSDLSWTKQTQEICKKANQKLGMLYRRFCEHCSTNVFM